MISAISSVGLQLMQFNNNDIKGLMALSNSVGWDYDLNEIHTILSTGRMFGHKNEAGKIVSSAAIISYSSKIASIGMVIVAEQYRGLGLGIEVTKTCINSVSKDTNCMLIATKEGLPLYKKLGFNEVDSVNKYLADSFVPSKKFDSMKVKVESFNVQDLNLLIKLDQQAFGDNRAKFLKKRIDQSEECLVIRDVSESVIGFGMSMLGPVNLILGPIVAQDAETASLLLHHLASKHGGKLRIDVPSGQEVFMSFLEESGFHLVKQPPIMISKSCKMPERNNTMYGIAAQIFG